jgi:predicted CXXCH cytochrome family protein
MRLFLRILFILLVAGMPSLLMLDNSTGAMETIKTHVGSTGTQDSCYVCHNKTIQGGLLTETKSLCFKCHQAKQAQSLKVYQHPDTGSIGYPKLSCEGCHRIHKANSNPLLTKADPLLCYDCHGDTKEKGSHPVVAFRDKYGNEKAVTDLNGNVLTCASHCHDVHGTDFKNLCSQEPGRELCIQCHKEFEE